MTTSTLWWRTDSRFSTTCPSRTRGRGFSSSCSTPRRFESTDEEATMIDLEAPSRDRRTPEGAEAVVVAALLAAAAVVAIALVATRNGRPREPADQPSPTVTVPPTCRRERCSAPPTSSSRPGRTSSTRSTEHRRRGSSSPSATGGRTSTTVGASQRRRIGFMTFSHPDRVFSDACHSSDGFYPGPVTTLDGLVTALSEQQGWAEVTAPSDISVDGYAGKAFQRTAPADFSDCTTRTIVPKLGDRRLRRAAEVVLRTGRDRDLVGPRPRRHGRRHQHETVAGAIGEAAAVAEFAAVLDSIRIDQASRLQRGPQRCPRERCSARKTSSSRRGRTTSTRSTDRRRRGSSSPLGDGVAQLSSTKGRIRNDDIGVMTFSRPDRCSQTPATPAMGSTRGR